MAVVMARLTIVNYLLVIYHVFNIADQSSSKMCTFKPYTDECGNRGWLWNCSKLNIHTVPRNISVRFGLNPLALDLSRNKFNTISSGSFSEININLLQNITALYLQYNMITLIRKSAFSYLGSLCVLDLSNCNLRKSSLAYLAFANLTKLKILRIHQNEFKYLGYPDIEISRILTLQKLTIGVFEEFQFSDQFRKLRQLESLILTTENSKFYLKRTTFAGLSNSPIHSLMLNFRNLVYCDVSEEIFCSFPVLKGVFIDFGGMCDLNVALLSLKCLQNRTMDYINANGNIPRLVERAVFLNKENCKYLFSICSKKVILSGNRIAGISDNPLKTRIGQCMEYFDISENSIEFVKPVIFFDILTRYPRLQVLNYSENTNKFIVNEAFPHNNSYIMKFRGRMVFAMNLSKHLKVLQISRNYFKLLGPSCPFDIAIFGEHLNELDVSYTRFPCKCIAPLQMPSLKVFDISNNQCGETNYPILQFAIKLEKFLAKNAQLGQIKNLIMEKFFIKLKRLKIVDLRLNNISYLPHTMFEDQKLSLSQLFLDGNKLSKIPVSHLQKLDQLYIRSNKISLLAKSDIDNILTLQKDIKIFIAGNPVSCECAHIYSLKWMRENQHKFGDLKESKCIIETISLEDFFQEKTFKEFEKKCQAYTWLTCSSIMLVLLLTGILTAACLKKYRVHIDYAILRLRNRWKGVMHVVNPKQFQFDAFVSYAEEDYHLACTTLYRELVRLGFQISLPDKDFIPGISKAEQLLQCIDDSRKVIIVVTENFLESGWDSYVVQMVVTHAFHNNRQKSIIVIIKDDIPVERIPKDLRYIWWSIISIRWPENGGNMISFWEEISTALHLN